MELIETQAETTVGQVYEHSRNNDAWQVVLLDEQIAVLRGPEMRRNGGNEHIFLRREYFEDAKSDGEFTLKPDSSLDLLGDTEEDWSDVAYVGDVGDENLKEAGFMTTADVATATKEELLEVQKIGEVAAENLLEYAT